MEIFGLRLTLLLLASSLGVVGVWGAEVRREDGRAGLAAGATERAGLGAAATGPKTKMDEQGLCGALN